MNQVSTKYFAGIGPRTTPQPILESMARLSQMMTMNGWKLRSGNARGADQAFQSGSNQNQREIFLPWEGYENGRSNEIDMAVHPITPMILSIAETCHPDWEACKSGARSLLCRNVPILLGEDLAVPVQFVATWIPQAYSGGTRHALNIAEMHDIRICNLADGWTVEDIVKHYT